MAQNDGLGTMLALYRAVWRVTGRQQVLLIALSLVIAALAAVKAGLLAAGSPP